MSLPSRSPGKSGEGTVDPKGRIMTAPDDLEGTDMGPDNDLHGVAEEVQEGLQGDRDDEDAAPTPGGG